ncbi:hypothetical protein [Parasphingorhabdus sp.]|uniref:hypothetical protein n=1 Tax=Parasphingorhabdus sp. TaxID=2709688 RepID=UPI003D278A23
MTQDDRTTPLGLFHYAQSYAKSAVKLAEVEVDVTHPDAPIRFLFSHAIELYLKSYLLTKGMTVNDLRNNYGHKISKLFAGAIEHGLEVQSEQQEQAALLDDAIQDRYLESGFRTVLTQPGCENLCRWLHNQIGQVVYKDAGLTRPLALF